MAGQFDETQALSRPPRQAGATVQPEARRVTAAEHAPHLRRRLMFIAACGAAAFGITFLVIVTSDGHVRPHRWAILLLALLDSWIVWALRRSPDVSLTRLKWVEFLVFAPGVLFYTWSTADALSVGPTLLSPGAGGLLTNYVALPWVTVIVVYGVVIPNTGRRCARVVGGMCLLALGSAVAGMALADAPTWAKLGIAFRLAVWLGVAAAIVTSGAYRVEALRREATAARSLGPYTLVRRLGVGGMGEVYYASHKLLRRPCAVKIIRAEYARDPDAQAQFEAEVQAAAQLAHPHAVRVYDYGRADDGTFYCVMEYLPGFTLHELVARFNPLPAGRAIFLLRQICSALGAAHAAGLVHRDVKPGNVIVNNSPRQADFATLLDFGLAIDRSAGGSGSGSIVGTPSYMAPEQAAGAALDHRVDIYAVGAVGYYLLTGRPPFDGGDVSKVLYAVELEPPVPVREIAPDVSAELEKIILRCLAKSPAGRYATADELDAALGRCSVPAWSHSQAATWWANRPDWAAAIERSSPVETLGATTELGRRD